MTLTLTHAARRALEACRAAADHPGAGLRIAGDIGAFELDLVAEGGPGDRRVPAADPPVWVVADLAAPLEGACLDWVEASDGASFEIRLAPDPSASEPSSRPRGETPSPADGAALASRVREVLHDRVNPFIASHGGSIRLVEMRGEVARVEMEGGCQGCAAARGTLNEIVERMLRADVPGLAGVEDVTDHAAGTNPFLPRSPSTGSGGFGLAPGTSPPPPRGRSSASSKRRTDLAVAAGRV